MYLTPETIWGHSPDRIGIWKYWLLGEGKPEYPEKNPRSKGKGQQQTLPRKSYPCSYRLPPLPPKKRVYSCDVIFFHLFLSLYRRHYQSLWIQKRQIASLHDSTGRRFVYNYSSIHTTKRHLIKPDLTKWKAVTESWTIAFDMGFK